MEVPQGDVITRVNGTDNQSGPANTRLPSALAATLTFSDGSVAPRTEVIWTILEGSGATLSNTLSVADGLGRAEASLTLGAAGTYRVEAAIRVAPDQRVTFTATSVNGPTITQIQPAAAAAYDTVVLTGTALTAATVAEVAGVPVSTIPGSAGSRRFVVPPCLDPGLLKVVAIVNGARSNPVSFDYVGSSDTVRLEPNDARTFAASALAGCATFPGTGAQEDAWYLLAPQAVHRAPTNAVLPYRLQGGIPPTPLPVIDVVGPEEPLPFAVRFHDWLRARDRDHAGRPKPELPPSVGAAPAEVRVGQKRNFRVCTKLECQSISDFPEVQAEAVFVGEHAIIYLDEEAPANGFTAGDLVALGELFDDELYQVATSAFGAESDVDGNGRVIILMTPVVNGLTPTTQCTQSIVTGFYFSIDVDPSFRRDARSNQAEVFYSVTPDPGGARGCRLSVARIRQVVPLTFIHEFQHMISYHQHVLVRGGSIEETWLNEAMSHVAEELAGRRFLAAGDSSAFARFVAGDLANSYRYLENPAAHRLVFDNDPGSLAERGGGWLFLRWIIDQYGDGMTRLLSETDRVGVTNLEVATQVPWEAAVTNWFLANAVSDHPDVTVPVRLQYRSWNFRVAYEALHLSDPDRFTLPFPIAPVVWSGSFAQTGSLAAGSGAYGLVHLSPNDPAFRLTFTGPAGEPFTTSVPYLGIVRLRPPPTPMPGSTRRP